MIAPLFLLEITIDFYCSLKLHEGVVRDVEQQQRRKHENRYRVQQQIDITKQLKQMQVLDDKAKSRNENGTPSDITKQRKQTQVVQEEAKKPKENVPPSDTAQQRIPSKSDNPPSSS